MKLTREEAIKLHRQMWTDMQKELGDTPSGSERENYKYRWVEKHFPDEEVANHCFLCEFCEECVDGSECPIDWGYNWLNHSTGCIHGKVRYTTSPISEILALPERRTDGQI